MYIYFENKFGDIFLIIICFNNTNFSETLIISDGFTTFIFNYWNREFILFLIYIIIFEIYITTISIFCDLFWFLGF